MKKRILMVAAENDALPGAKVGGVGDVIRDLPGALENGDTSVDVVLPSYGFLARLSGLREAGTVSVVFSKKVHVIRVLNYQPDGVPSGQYIFDHPAFAPQGEKIYCDDWSPFATDATKFALFNLAIAEALVQRVLPWPTHLHCHDWHAAFILMLREFSKAHAELQSIRTVFSIHNIAMQGLRPVSGEESSLLHWFPKLRFDSEKVLDSRYEDCVNPLRAGILLADKVHTVSPTYAEEILQPSNHYDGIYGGEGLEVDLYERKMQGDLIGILNGCEYPRGAKYTKPSRRKLAQEIVPHLEKWAAPHPNLPTSIWIAEKRLQQWVNRKSTGLTITSIGRLTEQKVRLLQANCTMGITALEGILNRLGKAGTFILLGSGDKSIEAQLSYIAARYSNFIFLNGYSDSVSQSLYNFGDLFLMPSSFEPCGISQLLAMRAGQPCLVNGVGGLKDTVENRKTGFVFEGNNLTDQADKLLGLFDEVMDIYESSPDKLKAMGKRAGEERFSWQRSAQAYHANLYC